MDTNVGVAAAIDMDLLWNCHGIAFVALQT
jgi:hypothetical protein